MSLTEAEIKAEDFKLLFLNFFFDFGRNKKQKQRLKKTWSIFFLESDICRIFDEQKNEQLPSSENFIGGGGRHGTEEVFQPALPSSNLGPGKFLALGV